MGKPLNLIGQRFGRLVVTEQAPNRNQKRTWVCVCDCGNVIVTTTQNLRKGDTKSCGCYKHDLTVERLTIHGETHTRLHNIWKAMRRRCCDVKYSDYKYYGERGITVCDEWKDDFLTFKEWSVANGYSSNLTLDRIDPNKAYMPLNCRWVSMKAQCNNRRNNVNYTYNGEEHTLSEWSERLKIPYHRLYMRLYNGWDFAKAISE